MEDIIAKHYKYKQKENKIDKELTKGDGRNTVQKL